jgi:hypothetical protein
MAILFADGFESGNFNAWTGTRTWGAGAISVENVVPHHGTYNMKVSGMLNGGDGASSYFDLVTPVTEAYARCYMQLSGLPDSGTFDEFGPGFGLLGAPAGSWQLLSGLQKVGADFYWGLNHHEAAGKTVYLEAVPSNPVVNRWYCVEVYLKIDAVNGIIRLWVDGVLRVEKTGIDTTFTANNIQNARLVGYLDAGEASALTMYGDCFVAADQYIGLEPVACMSLTGFMVFQS